VFFKIQQDVFVGPKLTYWQLLFTPHNVFFFLFKNLSESDFRKRGGHLFSRKKFLKLFFMFRKINSIWMKKIKGAENNCLTYSAWEAKNAFNIYNVTSYLNRLIYLIICHMIIIMRSNQMNIRYKKATITVIQKCTVKTNLDIPLCHKQNKRKLTVMQKKSSWN